MYPKNYVYATSVKKTLEVPLAKGEKPKPEVFKKFVEELSACEKVIRHLPLTQQCDIFINCFTEDQPGASKSIRRIEVVFNIATLRHPQEFSAQTKQVLGFTTKSAKYITYGQYGVFKASEQSAYSRRNEK